jgi:hypothetical protein
MLATTQRWSTGQPLPREEYRFCQSATSRLLQLSEVKARTDPALFSPLLYDMKAACREVNFGGLQLDPAVCKVQGAEVNNAPRWLEQFMPLYPKLQKALDARRGRFPARVRVPPANRRASRGEFGSSSECEEESQMDTVGVGGVLQKNKSLQSTCPTFAGTRPLTRRYWLSKVLERRPSGIVGCW